MSYTNSHHEGRLVLIPRVRSAFAALHVYQAPSGARVLGLTCAESRALYLLDEVGGDSDRDLFNFPFLFHANGNPWHEANSYLLMIMGDKSLATYRTDEIRRQASKLLDYLLFCESNNLDWLDFTGARPALRPTYKYYYHLASLSGRSSAVVNQYTSVVYRFYKYVCENWHRLDIGRVDTIKQVSFFVNSARGGKYVIAEKRSQTQRTPAISMVPIGFVREEGEDLRPLTNTELGVLLSVINRDQEWSTIERLILLTSLMTGARKQTVLTLRVRNLEAFKPERLLPDGSYKLHVGPGTGIDTKNNKPQILYFPKQLAEDLEVLASSPTMIERRTKFRKRITEDLSESIVDEKDMYLFLSDQGNCYYMAKSDHRYLKVKSPPTGQVVDTIKRKILHKAAAKFPKDFSYHWLRATYAYQIYQRLRVLINEGAMNPGEDIDFIQKRMHHEYRETTENYLKLFSMTHERIKAQEIWEDRLFENGYESLKLRDLDE